MTATTVKAGEQVVFDREHLPKLFDALAAQGHQILGPAVREGAIVIDELKGAGDLPEGWGDEQDGGKYRLRKRDDAALFGYVVGPQSWKKNLFPSNLKLWEANRGNGAFRVAKEEAELPNVAFVGVRACELAAIGVQDDVFMHGKYVDRTYAARRERVFIVAVNCTEAGGTCFCTSMGTGPRAGPGYDIALTELLDGGHRFLAEAGTVRGGEVLKAVPHRKAAEPDRAAARAGIEHASRHMGRTMEAAGVKDLLARNLEHPRWDKVAERCMTCANCTMACPTCFCSTVEDVTDLTGDHAERWRRWDSCFTVEFSYLHGGSVRPSAMSRYRQWMTHKLSTWHEQFGRSGCVGCGRCITWCPVGIDITEEARAIRETDRARKDTTDGDA
jgi:sulfhydrogenase subunit beta (sulfur reductase)